MKISIELTKVVRRSGGEAHDNSYNIRLWAKCLLASYKIDRYRMVLLQKILGVVEKMIGEHSVCNLKQFVPRQEVSDSVMHQFDNITPDFVGDQSPAMKRFGPKSNLAPVIVVRGGVRRFLSVRGAGIHISRGSVPSPPANLRISDIFIFSFSLLQTSPRGYYLFRSAQNLLCIRWSRTQWQIKNPERASLEAHAGKPSNATIATLTLK